MESECTMLFEVRRVAMIVNLIPGRRNLKMTNRLPMIVRRR
jgi:hypothetical protein